MFGQILKWRSSWLLAVLLFAAASHRASGQLLYVTNSGNATISTFVIDQDSGSLSEVLPRVAAGGIPTGLVVHPNGKFVLVSNGGANGNPPSLASFSIDGGTGALTRAGSGALAPGSGPAAVATDPAGKFAFVAQAGTINGASLVSVFAIDAVTGALTAVPGSPFTALLGVNTIAIHPNGKFAFVSSGNAAQIGVFAIGSDGALTPVAGSPFASAMNVSWLAMDPAGKFLFAPGRADNATFVYSVDASTGALTPVDGSPFPMAGGAMNGAAVDPAGKFLYISNGSGSVTTFAIGATGALTQRRVFQGAPPGAFATILDATGKFLYVPGVLVNVIGAFAIDGSNGALTLLPGQPFASGPAPQRGATVLLSPPVLPRMTVDSARNYFSQVPFGMPNGGIAQGSRIAISGKNFGPAVAAGTSLDSDLPLQTELGGVSVQIQSGGVTTAGLMVFAANGFVTSVVPSTTPLGDATLTVTYKGRTTSPIPITIVPSAVGIRTLNEEGTGPAKAFNGTPDTGLDTDLSTLPANGFQQPAVPGQFVVVQAMGLGAVAADESQNLVQVLDLPADVLVGNKLATVKLKVRVVSGVDYILFKLPDDVPLGCWVPLAVRTGGVTSNVATISVSASGGSCSDPGGFSASDIDAAQRSGQMRMGSIVLGHISFGPAATSDFANGIFGRYDFKSLLATYSPGNDGSGIRGAFATPPLGTCTVLRGSVSNPDHPFDTPGDPTPLQYLNAGPVLNLSGPQGTVQLPAPDYSFNPDGNAIIPGDYTVDNGAGTANVGAFKAVLNIPPTLNWTNADALTSLDRTQDLTVTWTGGNPDKEFAMIVGLSMSQNAIGGFLCTEKTSAGKFSVPAWVLSGLPQTGIIQLDGQPTPGGLLGVGSASFTSVGRFMATGLDFGLITYEQANINLVSYQ